MLLCIVNDKLDDTMERNNTLHKMENGDQIFASLECNGRTIVNISQSNFVSLDDVMRYVMTQAGMFRGLGRMRVRNASQGWSTAMMVASPRRSMWAS